MDDPHLAVLRQWMNAAELDQVRKEAGSADDIITRTKAVDQIIRRAEHREAIWQFIKMAGLAFVAVIGAVGAIKGLLPTGWLP